MPNKKQPAPQVVDINPHLHFNRKSAPPKVVALDNKPLKLSTSRYGFYPFSNNEFKYYTFKLQGPNYSQEVTNPTVYGLLYS